MSSGGSTGLPCTPAPTPFSLGPGGIRPEDLVAGISRLSVIQEMDTVTTQVQATSQDSAPNVAISVHEASGNPSSSLSNYFGSPQSSGDSVFDTLATPARAARSRAVSESQGNFQDVTIGTPAKTSASQHRSGTQTQVSDTAGGVVPGDSSPHVSSLSPAPPQTSELPPGSSPGSTPASPQLPNSLG